MLPPKMILLTLTYMANNLLYFVGEGQSFRVSQEIPSVKFPTNSLKVVSSLVDPCRLIVPLDLHHCSIW